MKNYNRFDVAKNVPCDKDAWMAAALFLTAWGIVAVIAALEVFGVLG